MHSLQKTCHALPKLSKQKAVHSVNKEISKRIIVVHRPLSYFMGTTSRMMAFFSVTNIFLVFTLASCIMFLLSTNKFSILISTHVLKELVEKINFDKRSENFPEVIILSILIILYHDDILKLLREN